MTDEDFLEQLTRHEGKVASAYQDHLGYWTIGVGRLIDKRKGGKLSDDEMQYLLKNDVNRFVTALDEKIPWWRNLTPNRQAVLANMAFNLGVAGLLGFKNTLKMIQAGDYNGAANGMLNSKWAEQVGRKPPSAKQPYGGRAYELSEMMRNG